MSSSSSATIPASAFVSVNPGVIGAGGAAVALTGLFLTSGTRVPIGQVLSFPSAAAVSTYFGPGANETTEAGVYFQGFTNSNVKPGALLFAQYPAAAVAGYLRGGNVSALTLAQLQAFTGTITISFAGTPATSSSISLSSATSFSSAATIIQAGFTSPPFTVSYDSVSGGFVFTSNSTGSTETVSYATGSLATDLALTQALGAVTSQGAAAATPAAFMTGLVAQNTKWANFTTLFDPDGGSGNTLKLAFATWTSQQNDNYGYIPYDTDITPTESTDAAASLGQLLITNQDSGTAPIYQPSNLHGATFTCGLAASIDYTETNGNTSAAYKGQAGLTPGVTNQTVLSNLIANGYNCYVASASGADEWNFLYPGSVSGPFGTLQRYWNQIVLNRGLQSALMNLLTTVKAVPYVPAGYALIEAACMVPINAALNFGSIQPGVTLSAAQIAEINYAAGANIASTLQSVGWYLQVLDPGAVVRAGGGSPAITLWYTDGGSVLQINLASVDVI